jgi:hypothetical protein
MVEEQITNENDATDINESGESIIKKHRSPNYPYIGLEAAVARASELQRVAGVHPIRVTTAWETWDYKKGAGNQIVAALDAYGLISIESGIADSRQIKLTLEARKILDNTSERGELLKVAALSPLLHRELWEYFNSDLPPNDKVIREYLVYQKNFNPSYVDKFIEQFRATLTFANVTKSDKIDVVVEHQTNSGNNAGGNEMTGVEEIKQLNELPKGRIFKASIEVLANGALDVIFAGSMNGTTVSLLKDIYDIKEKYESKVKAEAKSFQNETIVSNLPLLESGEESNEK